ncbi:hypothetical protein ElyMa_001365900 [Elysia marginata]|uniref:Secreted protein n=1 Tax=Elysia marginata TaxID=1093978 RepID=A0AAV4IPF5_9GAST|nr:hypothetical protein ElyMa_001365900 [Elysia marginata]
MIASLYSANVATQDLWLYNTFILFYSVLVPETSLNQYNRALSFSVSRTAGMFATGHITRFTNSVTRTWCRSHAPHSTEPETFTHLPPAE